MELPARSRPHGREEKAEPGKAHLFPEVLPQVFTDKLNPGVVAGPERKSLGAVTFQRRCGGRGEGEHNGEEMDNRMEREGCRDEGKRDNRMERTGMSP